MNKNLIIGAVVVLVVAISSFIIFSSMDGSSGGSHELNESTKALIKRQKESKFLLPLDFKLHPAMEAAITSGDADKIKEAKQQLAQTLTATNIDLAYDFHKSDYEVYANVRKWKESLGSSEDGLSLAFYALTALERDPVEDAESILKLTIPKLADKAPDNSLAQLAIVRACLKDNQFCEYAEALEKNIRDSKLKAGLALHFYRKGDKQKALALLKSTATTGVSNSLESKFFEVLDAALLGGQGERKYLHYFHYSTLVMANRDFIYRDLVDTCLSNYSNKDWQKACYDFGWKLFDAGDRKGKELATSGMQYLSEAQRSMGMKRLETIQANQTKSQEASKACAKFIKYRKNPVINDVSWRIFQSKLSKSGYQAANGYLCGTLK